MGWLDGPRNLAAGGLKIVGAEGVAEDISRGKTRDALIASNPNTKYDRHEAMANLAGVGDQYREAEEGIGEIKGKVTGVVGDLKLLGEQHGIPTELVDSMADRLNPSQGLGEGLMEGHAGKGMLNAVKLLEQQSGGAEQELDSTKMLTTKGTGVVEKLSDLASSVDVGKVTKAVEGLGLG